MAGAEQIFFKLGDYATKGDPQRQADFTYYMLWILFFAFASMFIHNMYMLFITWDFNFAIWAAIGFAIMSLQYFNLKQMYELRKLKKKSKPIEEEKVESVEEMMAGFNKSNSEKDNSKKKPKKKKGKKNAKV